MVDIDLLVKMLRRYGHTVESVIPVPENAGEYELSVDGNLIRWNSHAVCWSRFLQGRFAFTNSNKMDYAPACAASRSIPWDSVSLCLGLGLSFSNSSAS